MTAKLRRRACCCADARENGFVEAVLLVGGAQQLLLIRALRHEAVDGHLRGKGQEVKGWGRDRSEAGCV